MKKLTVVKRVLDLLMAAALVMLLCYRLFAKNFHIALGIFFVVMAIAHNVLNGYFWKALCKKPSNKDKIDKTGKADLTDKISKADATEKTSEANMADKTNKADIADKASDAGGSKKLALPNAKLRVMTALNILLIVALAVTVISAVFIVADFHTRVFRRFIFKRAHAGCASWLFVLSACHVGLHTNAIFGALKKKQLLVYQILAVLLSFLALFGLYCAFKISLFEVLAFQKVHFGLGGANVAFAVVEFLSIADFFAFLAHTAQKALCVKKEKGE